MIAETAIWNPCPRWVLMWTVAVVVFLCCKVVMRAAAGPRRQIAATHELAWMALWPGMDAATFFAKPPKLPAAPANDLPWNGFLNFLLGALLLWGVARHLSQPLAAGWVGMIGLVFLLHFGVFALLAFLWRRRGIPVAPLMDCPVAALSIAEFWGRRWNRAFRDLAHRLVFLPATRRWGPQAALGVSFVVSGLVHELVITLPAGAGYGLPTLYFALQAAGGVIERGLFHKTPAGGRRVARWTFTHLFTAGPVCLLFPPPFVERVMVPFFQFIHALP